MPGNANQVAFGYGICQITTGPTAEALFNTFRDAQARATYCSRPKRLRQQCARHVGGILWTIGGAG